MIKFNWHYAYVEEGELQPDKWGRWRLDCYILTSIDNFPKRPHLKDYYGDGFVPILVASIFQKGAKIGNVPSLIHRFASPVPSFVDSPNIGMSRESWLYSNDLEELKRMVENEFNFIRKVFLNCKAN